MKHVMLDLETLGTRADSVIMSIGAVRFDLDSERIDDNGFYASVSIDSNLDAKRHVSEDTLLWWLKQNEVAQSVFYEPKQSLEAALESFCAWFDKAEYIWSNGADFDIPMTAHALSTFGWSTPWEFFNSRCVRTMKNLPGMRNIKVDNAMKHNALADAWTQARQMQLIQKKLVSGHPMIKGTV